ncbi:type 1 glutamine amidotransferase domain-containing protein [Microbulbifer agarilyticus]|uniref:type 1 glutamine amidotransferase domain-containing protein n=1 Tax=Microbulbifer agarilyticus TaxID=260552 RepID=UPI001CD46BAB|nr:type 1 glutamine amidotransferase domain-containing protein [Microbulbifer agarilyticus]MCA0899723.1 type 1 glutamine amidotransferase domain-containing protein [Microbulbifer agarilyticus]
MLKKILATILCTAAILFGTAFWLKSLIPPAPDHDALARTTPADVPYLKQIPTEKERGRILVVVSSAAEFGNTGKKTGYEFTELARPYYVFSANGFVVDIASPQGGEPPAIMDKDDMGPFEYAFLNDNGAMKKLRNSIPLENVVADQYEGIFFAGGKGAMFDFPGNPAIQNLVIALHKNDGVIGAVCHGPAALADITLDTGASFLDGRRITSFTNEEELFLIPDAEQVFPFLLETRLRENGAVLEKGPLYLNQVTIDNGLVTGQNPWSSWNVTEAMVRALGYAPVPRKITETEKTVEILLAYENKGHDAASETLQNFMQHAGGNGEAIDRRLLAMHGLVAAMKGEMKKFLDIVRLLASAKHRTTDSRLPAS